VWASSDRSVVHWECRKILFNEHHRRENDLDLLRDARERGWELVTITPNNVAYLKREVPRDRRGTRQTRKCPRPGPAFRLIPQQRTRRGNELARRLIATFCREHVRDHHAGPLVWAGVLLRRENSTKQDLFRGPNLEAPSWRLLECDLCSSLTSQ